MATDYALTINLEFFGFCESMHTLRDAVGFVTEADRPNGGLVIDSLHLFRTGGSIADLKKINPDLIKMVQICDGPARIAPESVADEIVSNRLYPGEGEFPLQDFVRTLPADAIIGIEAPKQALGGKISALDQAKAMFAAMWSLYL